MPLENLNILDLSYNYIEDINPLEILKIPQIKRLVLNDNLIKVHLQKNIDILNSMGKRYQNNHFFIIITS